MGKRLEFITICNYEYLSIFSTSQVTLQDNCGVFNSGFKNQLWKSTNIVNFESIFPINGMKLIHKSQTLYVHSYLFIELKQSIFFRINFDWPIFHTLSKNSTAYFELMIYEVILYPILCVNASLF